MDVGVQRNKGCEGDVDHTRRYLQREGPRAPASPRHDLQRVHVFIERQGRSNSVIYGPQLLSDTSWPSDQPHRKQAKNKPTGSDLGVRLTGISGFFVSKTLLRRRRPDGTDIFDKVPNL